MPLKVKAISKSSSYLGLSRLDRALLFALSSTLLLGLVGWRYQICVAQGKRGDPGGGASPSFTRQAVMSGKVGHEKMDVSETSGTEDNYNVCQGPAAEPSTHPTVGIAASGPVPFFGRNDAASMREMASRLDHLLEEYKQDLVRVVQVRF